MIEGLSAYLGLDDEEKLGVDYRFYAIGPFGGYTASSSDLCTWQLLVDTGLVRCTPLFFFSKP